MRKLAAALAAMVLMAGVAGAEPFRVIVTDMEVPLVPNSVMELAAREGYFDRAGVEVEFVRVQQTPMALAALRAGEGEMANIGVDALLQAVGQGAEDLRAVMSPNKALPYLIAARGDIDSPAALAGKRFGIGRPGSVDHLLAMRVLAAMGVDPAGLEIVALGQPQTRGQALVAGQIDATTLGMGSYAAIDPAAGLRVLVDVEAFYKAAPVLSKVNAVRAETLAGRGREVEAVIEAMTLAARDFAADPARWQAAMAKARPDVPADSLAAMARAYAPAFTVNGGISAAELTAAEDWLRQGEDFRDLPPLPLERWVDLRPLEAVLARIGRRPGEG